MDIFYPLIALCSYQKILDLGVFWHQKTELPIPLGVNVIKNDLGEEKIKEISSLIKESIRYALDHKENIIQNLLEHSKSRGVEILDANKISDYLSLYANEDSFKMNEDCKKAIETLLDKKIKFTH